MQPNWWPDMLRTRNSGTRKLPCRATRLRAAAPLFASWVGGPSVPRAPPSQTEAQLAASSAGPGSNLLVGHHSSLQAPLASGLTCSQAATTSVCPAQALHRTIDLRAAQP